MYYFVYETTNLINGKTYRGCHKTEDLNDGYLGSGTLLRRAIIKYGKESFAKQILEFCLSEDDMYKIEKIYVDEQYINSELSYNLRCGGLGGRMKVEIRQIVSEKLKQPKTQETQETREKMRQAQIGKKQSKETIQKRVESRQGWKPTEESRQKMSVRAKSRPNNSIGTIWITNGMINKRVSRDSIIEDGWKPGRTY